MTNEQKQVVQTKHSTSSDTEDSSSASHIGDLVWLRRSDQTVIAIALGIALLGIAIWYAWVHSGSQSLMDLDRSEPRELHLLIDVNTASEEDLMMLPNVAEVIAKKIVAERASRGLYKSPTDFMKRVSGIGTKKFETMRRYLTGWEEGKQKSINGK